MKIFLVYTVELDHSYSEPVVHINNEKTFATFEEVQDYYEEMESYNIRRDDIFIRCINITKYLP